MCPKNQVRNGLYIDISAAGLCQNQICGLQSLERKYMHHIRRLQKTFRQEIQTYLVTAASMISTVLERSFRNTHFKKYKHTDMHTPNLYTLSYIHI